jgi:putative ABC transport system permease protein
VSGTVSKGRAAEDLAALRTEGPRGQIRFLSEAILLALAGGVAGVLLGAVSTAVYAHAKGWAIVIPPEAWAGGLGAALLIGALAGLLPAIRAARLSPTQALWTI